MSDNVLYAKFFSHCSGVIKTMVIYENNFINNVERDFRDMLAANTPYLKIAETDFVPITIKDPDKERREIRQGVYNNMIHKVSDSVYPFIAADFRFLESFPLFMDFGGYGLLEPHSFEIDLLFSHLCMFEYQFAYNIKYPVLVTLTDSKSQLKNRDYMFQFPLQVVLKDNFPRVRYSEAFGAEPEPGLRSECEPSQRLSGLVTVNVVDKENNGIDDVNVFFQCGPSMVYEFSANGSIKNIKPFADKCLIGSTDRGILKERFPQCKGSGMIILRRDGYLKKTEIIGDTLQDQERTLTFTLDRIYDKNIRVMKYFAKPPGDGGQPGVVLKDNSVVACNIYDSADTLQNYESALVRLSKIDPENGELMSPSIAFYNPGNASTISIAPGEYLVDIMLLRKERYNGEMTIKKHSQQITIEGSLLTDEEVITYPDEDVLLSSVFTGGAEFNWTVTDAELKSGDTITFYVFDEGPPKRIEDVSIPLDHREKCSSLNYGKIAPRLSK